MKNLSRTAALAACCLIAAGSAGAATVKCNSGQTISAAIAKLKPATGYVTINVSGACSDNIDVPPNLAVNLIGANGTTLVPANTSYSPLSVEGRMLVANMAITGNSFTGIAVTRGAFATLQGVTITGPGNGVDVSDNSGVEIQNTTIKVTGFAAINTWAGANVDVQGTAKLYQATATNLTGGQVGVNCAQGGITLNTTGGGPITIANNSQWGVSIEGCNLKTAFTAGFPITISGNGTAQDYGGGISGTPASQMDLGGTIITNNVGVGVSVAEGAAVDISGATITGNTTFAIQSSQNGVVHFESWAGVNTITAPAGDADVLFSCYQGGKIYVDTIANNITPAPTQNNIGCLTVGGP